MASSPDHASLQYSLAVDIGNSDSKFGLFLGLRCLSTWRVPTTHPSDEAGQSIALLESSLRQYWTPDIQINRVYFCSVVPAANAILTSVLRHFIAKDARPFPEILEIQSSAVGMEAVNFSAYTGLGADRFVNMIAAHHFYPGRNTLIIDLGTATTMDIISSSGVYHGGLITPGFQLFTGILASKTSQLKSVPLVLPPHIPGLNTEECLQAGLIPGYLALIRGLIRQIQTRSGFPCDLIVATGGLASCITAFDQKWENQESPPLFQEVRPLLTLEGLVIAGNTISDSL